MHAATMDRGLQRCRRSILPENEERMACSRIAAFFLMGCLLSLPEMVPAQARRPMTFEDLMKMRRLGDIAVSPDGKWVMFSATDVDLGKNTRTSHLWIVPVAGGEERALTASLAGESRGRFSPDGKQILFESTRDGGQQIWLADFNTTIGTIGGSHKLTSLSTETDGATWSPDGKRILFVSSVYPDCNDDSCNKKRDEERAESKVKAQVFTHLLYRHWNAFTGDKRSHLFLVSVDGGALRDLNPGDEHEVPPFSLGGPDGYGFSPDGKEIAFEENLGPVPAISTNSDVFTLRLDDPNAKPVKISTAAGGDHSPAYSPDGKYIAWRSQERAGYESDKFRLVIYDRATKQATLLFSNRPQLEKYKLSAMKPIEFSARDGMKLYGYLTTPAGVEPKSLPMVEFVHGGPWGRDEWGYDRYAQWLSNRGYAVLQINFRGSTGYGKKYVNAGDRQWAGTMHTDLLDGKDWVVKQGIADPARVCIMGGSYGGYATLAGVTFSPEAFACGVDIVGPSNLNTLLKSIPPYWSTFLATFHKRMGDSEEVLKQQSPLFKADQIKAPLLIGQGANDPRVNKAESDQIVAAMRKNNKPVQYYVFPDEGHGFARPTNNMAFNAATEEFLSKYLGGRFEPSTADESKLLTSIKQ